MKSTMYLIFLIISNPSLPRPCSPASSCHIITRVRVNIPSATVEQRPTDEESTPSSVPIHASSRLNHTRSPLPISSFFRFLCLPALLAPLVPPPWFLMQPLAM